jgi:hypothetical protein
MASVTRKVIVPTVLYGVTYDEYVRLRRQPRNDHLRMIYHDGVLELLSPEYRHEGGSYRIDMVMRRGRRLRSALSGGRLHDVP